MKPLKPGKTTHNSKTKGKRILFSFLKQFKIMWHALFRISVTCSFHRNVHLQIIPQRYNIIKITVSLHNTTKYFSNLTCQRFFVWFVNILKCYLLKNFKYLNCASNTFFLGKIMTLHEFKMVQCQGTVLWHDTCLASVKSWVRFLIPKKQNKMFQKIMNYITKVKATSDLDNVKHAKLLTRI